MNETEQKVLDSGSPSQELSLSRLVAKSDLLEAIQQEADSKLLLEEKLHMQVLIVEDDKSARRAMKLLLQGGGWSVTEAGTVLDGLHYLCENPQWVILDLMLTDGDGIAVLERIRNAGLPIKVAVVTGVGDFNRISKVSKLNPELLMRKPVNMKELLLKMGGNSTND